MDITLPVWFLVIIIISWIGSTLYMWFDTKHLREENRTLSFYLDIYQGRVSVEEIEDEG